MKEKGYYHRWIHPINKLHQDQLDLKAYFYRPVGDRPELMPWDLSCNQDIHLAVMRHVLFTSMYAEDDERKFSLSTPRRTSYAYRRLLHPVTGVVPSSHRICHDVLQVFDNLMKIYKDEGKKDPTLAKRSGHRWVASKEERRGGKREKQEYKDLVLHPHAIEGRKVKLESSRERFGSLENNDSEEN